MGERCVCCDEKIPEGRQACPKCVQASEPVGHLFGYRRFMTFVQEGYICDYDGSGTILDEQEHVIGVVTCDVRWLKRFLDQHPEAKYVRWCNK